MSMRFHIIYIPGFGDSYDIGRCIVLPCWRVFGVGTTFVPMRWNNAENYEQKLARLDAAIDAAAGKRIIIIGESAGATMALAAYGKRHSDLYKVMTVCGKTNNMTSVAPRLYVQHKAFREALQQAELATSNLSADARERFVAFYPWYDDVIPFSQAVIPGCRVVRLPSVSHLLTIFLALTLFSGYITHVAKQASDVQ